MLLDYIDRFGVKAVTGRDTLGAGELKAMVMAENIRRAYWSRDAYKNSEGKADWAEWAQKHPELNRYLTFAERVAYGE